MQPSRLGQINKARADSDLADSRHRELLASGLKVSSTVLSSTEALIRYLEGHTTKTEVVNQLNSISTPDVKFVVQALNILDNTLKNQETTDLTEITQVMQAILNEAKQIPKSNIEIPEHEDIDYSKQFDGLTKAIQAVEKVVKAQKLIAEAPIVNVPETTVNVDAPNLKPLQDSIKAVVEAVTSIVIPEYKTDNTGVEKLLKTANVTLTKLLLKPVGGGGGGGSSWPAIGTNGQAQPLNLDASGNLKTVGSSVTVSSEATTSLSNSITNATALVANSSRLMATFFNDDTASIVYLKCGITASATSYKIRIAPGGYYELPSPVYRGIIDVIATSATGSLRITETI